MLARLISSSISFASACRKAAYSSGFFSKISAPCASILSLYFRRVQRLGDGGMELADDLARGFGRRRDPVPGAHREIAIARLGHGRRVGQRLGARRAGDRERAHLAALHLRQHRRDVEERQVDPAADQIDARPARRPCRARRSASRRRATAAARRETAECCRPRPWRTSCCRRAPGGGDELRHALVGAARRHDQHVGNVGDGGDRRKSTRCRRSPRPSSAPA